MKYNVIYCEIEYGANLFASPQPYSSEVVECDSIQDLDKYICAKSDRYNHRFSLNLKKSSVTNNYRYLSSTGGVKISEYKPLKPRIKKI